MKKVFMFIVLASLLMVKVQAKVLRVNNTPGSSAPYATFESAYDASVSGDTIYLEGSEIVYSPVAIRKKLAIIGPGYLHEENGITNFGTAEAIVGGGLVGYEWDIMSDGVVLRGISMNTSLGKLNIESNNVVVNRCCLGSVKLGAIAGGIIHQNYLQGAVSGDYKQYSSNTYNVQITNNMIGNGIGTLCNSTIDHNTIYNNSSYVMSSLYSCTVTNNIYKNFSITDNVETSVFSHNYYGEKYSQYFADMSMKEDNDFVLLKDSPLMTMGSDGGQVGAFGGSDPYVLSGIPNIPVIRSLVVPASANKHEGLNVTVKITTER